jgi:hypothetical protein
VVCFHAHQCVDRLIKALIVARRGKIPDTRDLPVLSAAASQIEPNWSPVDADLLLLRTGALVYGEPGSFPSAQAALDALAACRRLRSDLLTLL